MGNLMGNLMGNAPTEQPSNQKCNTIKESAHVYSSDRKNFVQNEVLGFDPNTSSLAPTHELQLPDMSQTDIQLCNSIYNSEVTQSYKSVGLLLDESDNPMGSCILLPKSRILITRHVIEGGVDVRAFKATFGYYTGSSSCTYHGMQEIIENNEDLDYAIIQLSSSPQGISPMKFDTNIASDSTALLHYPLGKSLQVSVRGRDNSSLCALRFMTYHDSDFGSSGGAYMNHEGKCSAIHLGCEHQDAISHNTTRYALEIGKIHDQNSHSLLFLPDGKLPSIPLLSLPLPSMKRGYEDEKNRTAEKKEALKNNKKALVAARNQSLLRTYTFKGGWETHSVRELADHFPYLGKSILKSSNITYKVNKIFYSNKMTGWYICYDQAGDYSTVRKNTNRYNGNNELIYSYVAWDLRESTDGKGSEFHFNNNSV